MESACALSENLASLLRREHGALAEFLVALAETGWLDLASRDYVGCSVER